MPSVAQTVILSAFRTVILSVSKIVILSVSKIVILSGARSAQPKDPCILQREGRRHEPTQAHHQTSQAPATKLPKLTHLHRILFLFLIVLTPQAHAQGCTQCLDSTRATPPQVQAAYRHAILLLGGTAASLFLAGALLLRKNR